MEVKGILVFEKKWATLALNENFTLEDEGRGAILSMNLYQHIIGA